MLAFGRRRRADTKQNHYDDDNPHGALLMVGIVDQGQNVLAAILLL
jgi:hypothetical protein